MTSVSTPQNLKQEVLPIKTNGSSTNVSNIGLTNGKLKNYTHLKLDMSNKMSSISLSMTPAPQPLSTSINSTSS